MKVAMSSWSYHSVIGSGKMDQFDWLKHCKELGLDGVELLDIHFHSLEPKYLKTLKQLIAGLGLEVPLCSVSNDFGKPGKKDRDADEKLVGRWIELAQFFDSPALRVFSGWPGGRDKSRYETEKAKLWPEMIERLNRLAEKAGDAGLALALENHNHFGFARTAQDLLQIIEEVDSDWLFACLDTGDYLVDTAEVNGYKALEKVLPYAEVVRAKFYGLDDKGRDKKLDWEKIFKLLKKESYDGYLSIEYEGGDAQNDVPAAAKYLLKKTR
jgi:sugar phosphate isomerase/epimerase